MARTAEGAGYWRQPPSHSSIGATVVPVAGRRRVLVGGYSEGPAIALFRTLRALGVPTNVAIDEEDILNALQRPVWDLVLLCDDELGNASRAAKIYAFMVASGSATGRAPVVVLSRDSDIETAGPAWIIEVLARHEDRGTEIVRALLSDIARETDEHYAQAALLRASGGYSAA